jgi:hypothetical protein
MHGFIFKRLLHVSYRLDFKKGQAHDKDQDLIKILNERFQKQFLVELGLFVDKSKPGGSISSNDGNIAYESSLIQN